MTGVWTIYDADGQIVATFKGREETLQRNLEAGQGYVAGDHDGDTHYVLGGEVAERPSLGLPRRYIIASGADWSLPDMPEGTGVTVKASDGGVEAEATADADGVVLSFARGRWTVEFRPPFPWLDADVWVGAT